MLLELMYFAFFVYTMDNIILCGTDFLKIEVWHVTKIGL